MNNSAIMQLGCCPLKEPGDISHTIAWRVNYPTGSQHLVSCRQQASYTKMVVLSMEPKRHRMRYRRWRRVVISCSCAVMFNSPRSGEASTTWAHACCVCRERKGECPVCSALCAMSAWPPWTGDSFYTFTRAKGAAAARHEVVIGVAEPSMDNCSPLEVRSHFQVRDANTASGL